MVIGMIYSFMEAYQDSMGMIHEMDSFAPGNGGVGFVGYVWVSSLLWIASEIMLISWLLRVSCLFLSCLQCGGFIFLRFCRCYCVDHCVLLEYARFELPLRRGGILRECRKADCGLGAGGLLVFFWHLALSSIEPGCLVSFIGYRCVPSRVYRTKVDSRESWRCSSSLAGLEICGLLVDDLDVWRSVVGFE